MRALTSNGSGDVKLETNRPEPAAAPGETLVRPTLAAVTRTDLAIARGLGGFTGILGHQFVGQVHSANGTLPAGRRVVVTPSTFCGVCDMCQAGLRQHCRDRTMVGLDRRDGCLCDAVAVPDRNLLEVPAGLDDDHAVFAYPLAAALHAARQLTIVGKPFITVLGDGPLGLLTAQVMGKLNASVRLVGKHAEKLAVCEKWNIKHRPLADVGRRADQDIVVDCTGSPSGLTTALDLVRPRGTVVLKTLLPEAPEIDLTPLVRGEVTLIGSHAGSLEEALAVLERHEVDVVSLISRRMSLDDGVATLQAADRADTLRVLVTI